MKKDIPTLLYHQRENNLDQEWLLDRIEEMMLEVIGAEEPYEGQETKKLIRECNMLKTEQRKRLQKILGRD